jgi:Bacterial Ig domain/Dockerin type I domain
MHRSLILIIFAALFVVFPVAAGFSQTPSGTGSTYRGDINQDGRVNIFDLLALLQILATGEIESERQQIIANVDNSGDGKINIFDLLALLRVLSGTDEPDIIVWGPPAIESLSQANASPGDTLTIFLENVPAESDLKILFNGEETAVLESAPDEIKLFLPEDFVGGMFSLVVDSDTLDSKFVNIPNPNPPVIAGCQIFPADNPWNQPIEGFPVHALSDNYIEVIKYARLHPDVSSNVNSGIPYVVVGGNQPRVPLEFTYIDESDPGPYPIPEDAPIEGGETSTGDRHILVLDSTNCMLYETFSTYSDTTGPGWRAGSGAVFDLTSNAIRPDTWTSSDAAGLPILPGLVRYDEVAAGEVNHAIRYTVRSTQRAYIYPATHFASSSNDTNLPPMGLRVRLKADYDISRFTGQALVIARALQKYGIILADNGGDWYFTGAGDSRWNNDELDQLKVIYGRDLEVVDVSAMVVSGKDERLNIRPGVSITSPEEGALLTPGADVTITAEAYDYDGTVALVEFFQGDTKLGEAFSEPYEIIWSGPAEGTYSITARATDNGGTVNTCYPVTVTVGNGL